MKSKSKAKKKEKVDNDKQHILYDTDYAELWSIISFISALFIFMALQFPNSTGIVGRVVIDSWGLQFFGKGLQYLPAFLLVLSLNLVLSKRKREIMVLSIFLAFFCLTVYFELMINGPGASLSWPIPKNGGGTLGYFGLFALDYLIGPSGTQLLIIGAFIAASIFSLNISLGRLIKKIVIWSCTVKREHNLQTLPEESTWKKVVDALFYRKVPVHKGPPKVRRIQKEKNTPTKKQITLLPSPNIEDPIKELQRKEPITIQMPTIKTYTNEKKKISPQSIPTTINPNYKFPSLSLLEKPKATSKKNPVSDENHQMNAKILEETLASFNVDAKVINITPGPTVTRYELQPGIGVKISKITNLTNDIALKLAAPDVRIEAPIPGKALIGIEIPNKNIQTITLRDIIETSDFYERASKLVCAMGITITGDAILMDLAKMPHILIAGATGSGKSVCINAIITSILLKSTPDEVKFLMIDPKKVELSLYDGIPHLISPVVTNPHKAAATLKRWALTEMENRYETFSQVGVKNIEGYNDRISEIIELAKKDKHKAEEEYEKFINPNGESEISDLKFEPKKLPYIVVIIDELADLMMVASQEVETTICRLAQMARATGIHLVIATQRPSVNVITGLIKANVPSRISFYLQSQIDSRTVLDTGGAEKLLGKGDMLYSPVGSFKPQRAQGIYVSEKEIKNLVSFVKKQGQPTYLDEIIDIEPLNDEKSEIPEDAVDELYAKAKEIVMTTQYASTSYLQRKLRIGYNRAARIMDQLKEDGVVDQYATQSRPN